MGKISISDETYSELVGFADAYGVSADQQAEVWLRDAISRHSAGRDLRALFSRIAAMTPRSAAQSDSVDLLREVRNR
jgi:hypothetical protein